MIQKGEIQNNKIKLTKLFTKDINIDISSKQAPGEQRQCGVGNGVEEAG